MPAVSPATRDGKVDLVDMTTLVPDIALEIRYAGSDNFVGRPIDGYLAPKCLLLRPAAQALQRVEASLRQQHLRMKLFDCYRPVRAVRDFVRWAEDLPDQRTKPHYYRLHSPTFLIEYLNAQDDASHQHAVWRDLEDDYGLDALRLHLERAQSA